MPRHALITGGGTGIGLATARHLAAQGLDVTVAGRRPEVLEATGLPHVVLDVTDPDSIGAALENLAPVDVFVSNAGDARTAPLLKTSPALWDSMLAVNLSGALWCAQAAVPGMIKRGWGRFIVIASTASLRAYRYTGAYTAAKHGVLGLVKTLALEIAQTGVTANAICPGFTETDLMSRSVDTIMQSTGMSAEDARAALIKDNPQGRAVQADEVAAAAAWLASDAAGSCNGHALTLDGGELAG